VSDRIPGASVLPAAYAEIRWGGADGGGVDYSDVIWGIE